MGQNEDILARGASKSTEIPPSGVFVDEEGDWYHEGSRIFRDGVLHLFLESLCMDSDGRYIIDCGGTRCTLDVADTPLVVSRVDRKPHPHDAGREVIAIRFRHLPDEEVLDPQTLYVGRDNVIYCRVRGGRFPARFSRPAYYQLASWVEEDETGAFFLNLNGVRYTIK
jgi:uncharacterized protein